MVGEHYHREHGHPVPADHPAAVTRFDVDPAIRPPTPWMLPAQRPCGCNPPAVRHRLADLIDEEITAANAAADRRERCIDAHGYGCASAECGRGVSLTVAGLSETLPAPTKR